jgi:hypothetical protein
MLLVVSSFGQASAPGGAQPSDPAKPPEPNDKRVLWIIPNYQTFPTLTNYKPIAPKEKFASFGEFVGNWRAQRSG